MRLSYKELKVAQLRVEGKSAKEIAFLLDRSTKTIDNHLTAIHKTLGIHSKDELPTALARYIAEALKPLREAWESEQEPPK